MNQSEPSAPPGGNPRAADWDAELNEAAVHLLVGGSDETELLRAVHERLTAIAGDATRPAWERDAVGRAIATIAEALAGSCDTADALPRVAELLELAMSGVEPTGAAPAVAPVAPAAPAAPAERTSAEPPATSPRPTPAARMAAAARELFPAFLDESLDYLAQAESALLELEADPTAAEALNVVFRAFHSIKSSAAFLGLEPLSALAHDAESLLLPVRDGGAAFDRDHANVMLATADLMRELLAQARTGAEGATDDELPAAYAPLRQRIADAVRQAAVDGAAPAAASPTPATPATTVDAAAESSPAADDASAAAGPTRPPALTLSVSSSDGWARVRTLRLDQLVDLVSELVIAHSMIAQDPAVVRDRHGPLARKVMHTSKIVRELQALSIGLRMVPLRPLFQRLHRLVRDLANQSDKRVELVSEGEETEIDRTMVDVLTDPLVHMIRNAVDHALELPAEREAHGKPVTGTLRLAAYHAGGAVIVELQDDGRGLDRERILRKAIERGIVAEGQELSAAEIDGLIFAPGLSTAPSVTEISGRGVGMDVVRRNIEALRGHIEIASVPGAGTKFTLRLPLTLAVTDGMQVKVGSERYIVPTFSIVTSFRPTPTALTREAHGGEMVMLHGRLMPVVRLHHVFGVPDGITDPAAALLVVINDAQERYALMVDRLLGQQQFVAKPITDGIAAVPGVAGSAVMGDGRVGLIIDPAGLLAGARRMPPWT